MSNGAIVMNEFDHRRLSGLLDLLRRRGPEAASDLEILQDTLRRAQVVPEERVPATLVTMNTEFQLRDQDTGEQIRGRLVFPSSERGGENGVSILSPLGRTVFGSSEGEVLTVRTTEGVRRWLIERVDYQPEASGHRA